MPCKSFWVQGVAPVHWASRRFTSKTPQSNGNSKAATSWPRGVTTETCILAELRVRAHVAKLLSEPRPRPIKISKRVIETGQGLPIHCMCDKCVKPPCAAVGIRVSRSKNNKNLARRCTRKTTKGCSFGGGVPPARKEVQRGHLERKRGAGAPAMRSHPDSSAKRMCAAPLHWTCSQTKR